MSAEIPSSSSSSSTSLLLKIYDKLGVTNFGRVVACSISDYFTYGVHLSLVWTLVHSVCYVSAVWSHRKEPFSFCGHVVLMFEVKLRAKFDFICVVYDTNKWGDREDNKSDKK